MLKMENQNEIKGFLDLLLRGFAKVFSGLIFREQINKFIVKKYDEGLIKAEDIFNVNFVRTDKNVEFLKDYVQGNVGNVVEQVNQDLRQELQRAILDGLSIEQTKQRIKAAFADKKYMNRLKMVIRTEGLRAGNTAQMDAARQTGLKIRKYLDITMDDRTSPICIAENAKYGTKEKSIPLEEDFVVTTGGKTYRAQQPPMHPNCRTVVMFVEE